MKKKVLKMLFVAASVLALSGCGQAKAPTLEELKDGIGTKDITDLDVTGSLTMEGELELTDVSDEIQQYLDLLEAQMDMDLSDGVSAKAVFDFKVDGNNSEDASRMEGELSVDFESNIDAIEDAALEAIGDEDTLKFGTYIDKEEEIKYNLEKDGTWTYSDYEEDDDDDDDTDPTEVFGKILDIVVAHNDGADEKDSIKVEAKDGEYVINYEFTLDNDYISNMGKSEKKELNALLDLADVDFDLDDIESFYEEYSDYATISFPLSLELRFVDNGEKKDDREFYLTGVEFSMEGSVSTDLSADEVRDIVTEVSSDPGMDLCGITGEASIKLEFSVTIGYDGEEEVSIPKSVTKEAIPADEYDEPVATTDSNVAEVLGDAPVEEPDDVITTTTTTASSDGIYTLVDYSDMDIFTFAVPDGWEIYGSDEESTYFTLTSDAGSYMTIKCYVPSDIMPYFSDDYELDEDSSIEYLGNVVTKYNSFGYDLFYDSTWEEYTAVLYGDEYTSMVIVISNSYTDSEFGSSDDVEDFLKANF